MTSLALDNSRIRAIVDQTLNNPLEFVAAQLPESVSIKPASYILIRAQNTVSESAVSSEQESSAFSPEDSATAQDTPVEGTPIEGTPVGGTPEPSTEFYDINELEDDRGSRVKSRIRKSWSPGARAPMGLDNHAVTCYMNSAIQALVHIPAMAYYLQDILKGKYTEIRPNSVSYELANLYLRMIDSGSKKKSIYPNRLIRRLTDINALMSEWQQEDSHEYFMSLVGRLQEDSVPKGKELNSSMIYDIFGGKIKQQVICKNCDHISTTHQDFYDLSVSFSVKQKKEHKKFTLEGSLKEFFSPEIIKVDSEGKHGYQCEKCKKTTSASKISQIDESPEYWAIHVKRFKFQGSSSHKLKEPLQYPMDLDVGKYSVSGEDIRYRLMSVIVHEGRTASSGHYVALCRQPNNSLVEYDDETMRKVSERYFLKQDSAYMFVYSKLLPKKKTTDYGSISKVGMLPQSSKTQSRKTQSPKPQSPAKGFQPSKRAGEEIDRIFDKRARQ